MHGMDDRRRGFFGLVWDGWIRKGGARFGILV